MEMESGISTEDLFDEARDLYVDEDYEEAAVIFQKLINEGHPMSHYMLGEMYEFGYGMEEDHIKAFELYRMAATKFGIVIAYFKLGFFYYHGKGVKQNYASAVECLTKAANNEDDDAQVLLAICFHDGDGVRQDHEKAIEWMHKAARQGNENAQCLLGYSYYTGEGVAIDQNKAFEFWHKAAAQGNARAQEALDKFQTTQTSSSTPSYSTPSYSTPSYSTPVSTNTRKKGSGKRILTVIILLAAAVFGFMYIKDRFDSGSSGRTGSDNGSGDLYEYLDGYDEANTFPLTGRWFMTARDVMFDFDLYKADLVIEETNRNNFSGYIDWTVTNREADWEDYLGREFISGEYNPQGNTIVLRGQHVDEAYAINIVLGVYEAVFDEGTYDFISGTWRSGGTWQAAYQGD